MDLDELREIREGPAVAGPADPGPARHRLAERWPGHEPASLAYAATHLLPLVQVPPRGLWGHTGQATYFLAAAWLDGRPRRTPPDPAAWLDGRPSHAARSGRLAGRPRLAHPARPGHRAGTAGPALPGRVRPGHGERHPGLVRPVPAARGDRPPGRAAAPVHRPRRRRLLDLADATRPDPDVPAPPRFLPAYDNLLLSFAERRRVIPHDRPVPLPPGNGATTGTLLVDGLWRADWTITRGRDRAVLHVRRSARWATSRPTPSSPRAVGCWSSPRPPRPTMSGSAAHN